MPVAARRRRNARRCRVLVEDVFERVARLDRSVRPAFGPEELQKSALRRQRLAAGVDVVDGRFERMCDRSDRELDARDARGLEDAALERFEALESHADELGDRLGTRRCDLCDGRDESKVALYPVDRASLLEVVHERDRVERIAAGRSVEDAGKLRRKLVQTETNEEVLFD